MNKLIIGGALALTVTAAGAAENVDSIPANACELVRSAFGDMIEAIPEKGKAWSVEAMIAQRRLHEQFCLRSAQCAIVQRRLYEQGKCPGCVRTGPFPSFEDVFSDCLHDGDGF
jgi:hypothetical protein